MKVYKFEAFKVNLGEKFIDYIIKNSKAHLFQTPTMSHVKAAIVAVAYGQY